MNEYLAMWKNFANFQDRTSKRGYWMAVLFNVIFALVVAVVAVALKMAIVSTLYSVAIAIPGIAITIRRLHDIGKPGYWILAGCIPVIGGIWLIVLLAGDTSENAIGEVIV